MLNAIIDDIKVYFSSLLKKEGRYLLITGILSILFSVIEILLFSIIFSKINVIAYIIYVIALYYGYKYLIKFLQKALIKAKVIKYIPDDYAFNGYDGMYDERALNNLQYKEAIDHYDAVKAYIVILSIASFIFLSLFSPYGIIARLVFVLIAGLIMYFLTIEPIEYMSGTNNKQPNLIDKVKDGFGLGNNKSKENLSSITSVIDNFKQSELNQQPGQVQPEVLDETALGVAATDDYYRNRVE